MPAQFPFGSSNATPLADYALGESYDAIHAVYLRLADITNVSQSSVAILEASGLITANIATINNAVTSVNETKVYLDGLRVQVVIAEQNILQISGGYTSLQSAVNQVQSDIATATDLSNATQQLYDDFVDSADTLAPKNSPVFTGNPQAPTPVAVDNGTTVATTAFVHTAIEAAQHDLTLLAPNNSPVFTGQPTAPTPVSGNSSTALATTQFVQNAIAGNVPIANSVCIPIACSDETTPLTTGLKVSFRMPFGMRLTEVFACTNTSPTGATLIVDVMNNITSVLLAPKLTIDPDEDTSASAAVHSVISTPVLAKNDKISIIVLAVGSIIAGTGLKVFLTGTPL